MKDSGEKRGVWGKGKYPLFHHRDRGSSYVNIKLVLALVLASCVVIFIVQNVTVVEVSFLFWTIALSRSLLIFFSFILGLAVGWFLHTYVMYRRSQKETPDTSLIE